MHDCDAAFLLGMVLNECIHLLIAEVQDSVIHCIGSEKLGCSVFIVSSAPIYHFTHSQSL